MNKIQWKGVTGGGKAGQRGLLLLFKYCNIRIGYLFLFFVIPFYFVFAPKQAQNIYRYFRRRHCYNRFKSFWKTCLNHFYFGQVVLDRFAVFAGQGNQYSVEITGIEFWNKVNADNKGCLVLSSHVGNFEIAGYLMNRPVKKMNSIIFEWEAIVMQQQRQQILTVHNINLIPVKEDFSHIFLINEALDNEEIVSLPSDRMLSGNKTAEIELFGKKAIFPTGAFHVAASKDTNLLTFFVMREKALRYHIYIHPLLIPATKQNKLDTINALAGNYVAVLEQILRKYPEQWYNFYDFWNDEK